MKVKFKRLYPEATIPTKATEGSAAYDLYSVETAYIPAGEMVTIGTGLSLEIPKGWKGEIYSRSGFASKGIVVANSPGKIDSDYRGEIQVLLHNIGNQHMAAIGPGERIAQLELNPVYDIEFEEVVDLSTTERGDMGFGSTGYH